MKWVVILILWVAFSVIYTACQEASPVAPRTPTPIEESEQVTKYEDHANNVVCYTVYAGLRDGGVAIDCIQLTQP
jgi:hypothetical protein